MAVSMVWASGYRSLIDVRVRLGQVTVVLGENGSGKTNLYRALRLLSKGAAGRLAHTLLEDGGMPSILWSGERPDRKAPVRCVLGAVVHDLSYELVLGLPPPVPSSPFTLDPQIKQEMGPQPGPQAGSKPGRRGTSNSRSVRAGTLRPVAPESRSSTLAGWPALPSEQEVPIPGIATRLIPR